MDSVFQTVLGMSGTASLVILVVLAARLVLRKAPKLFSYVLWAAVLFRLLCPFAIQTRWGMVAPVQAGPPESFYTANPPAGTVQTVTGVGSAAGYEPGPAPTAPVAPPDAPELSQPEVPVRAITLDLRTIAAFVWLAGAVLLLGHSAVSLLLLRRRLAGWVPLEGEKNVRLADHIPSPFVLGLARPKIYLPSDLPEAELEYILLHERTHIRRLDHITRALAWLALSIHWFNPLVWLAFYLAGKDMEMSCDEAVLRNMGRDVRADYSSSLLRLSVGGKLPAGPLAFGGGDIQRRIKNVLRYKKPAFWVVAVALVAVLCTGVALATNQETLLIDPDSIVSGVTYNASSFTHRDGTIVYTPEDCQNDLQNPADPRELPREDGAELARLINSYRKTVYGRGGLLLNGGGSQFTRLNCSDGTFYLVNYWCWHGFNFNPFHGGGEDDYTTLVTYYDADGVPGTTWQMEYDFDKAYSNWVSELSGPTKDYNAVNGIAADIAMSIDQAEDGVPFVRMEGTVDGIRLERTVWNPPEWSKAYGMSSCPLGQLWFEAPLCNNEVVCGLDACWTDESRTAVKVTATPRALFSSYSNAGNLIFTVDLSRNGGTLADLEGHVPKLAPNAPELVPTEEEAVKIGRIAAKLMLAAEDFYYNHGKNQQALSNYTPVYTMNHGYVLIEGIGDAYVQWGPIVSGSDSRGSLYFAKDPVYYCPRLAGEAVEGGAYWSDESTFRVNFNVNDQRVSGGTISGFRIEFSVDMDAGAVLDRDFQSRVEGAALELTDAEMVETAVTLSQLIEGARDFYQNLRLSLTPAYSLSDYPYSADINGLDCDRATWNSDTHSIQISARVGVPEHGMLGLLHITNPRFFGGRFTGAQGLATVCYFPDHGHPMMFVGFTDYNYIPAHSETGWEIGTTETLFTVDLASGTVTIPPSIEREPLDSGLSDTEAVALAQALAQIIQGASDFYTKTAPPQPEPPLPLDAPVRLMLASGAGSWGTSVALYPDGSFMGNYSRTEGTTQYVCWFHGQFGDIRQASAASWSMTLEELVLDTGHPIGEEWEDPGDIFHYVSSVPVGFTKEDREGHDAVLEPGAEFVFYTPEASSKPGGELYGMEDPSSDLHDFWYWWPGSYGSTGEGELLDCCGLRNVEGGYGFFDSWMS